MKSQLPYKDNLAYIEKLANEQLLNELKTFADNYDSHGVIYPDFSNMKLKMVDSAIIITGFDATPTSPMEVITARKNIVIQLREIEIIEKMKKIVDDFCNNLEKTLGYNCVEYKSVEPTEIFIELSGEDLYMKDLKKELSNLINVAESIKEHRTSKKHKVNESTMPEDVKAQVEAAIKEYIAQHGDSFEIYVDYRDELDSSTIKKIFESDNPFDAFYEIIGEWDWWESAAYEYDYIFENNLELSDEIKENYRTEILEMLGDYVSYNIPYKHFDETVGFDVYLHDADSANREYYDMLVFTETDEQDEDGDYIKELSEINGMLTKFLASQGYSAEQFIEYYNAKQSGDEFLDSLIQEIENTNYGDGRGCQIAFLVQAPITDMAEVVQNGGTITIPKTAMCGLVESFNGSGSLLDIKLKQDITGTTKEKGKAVYQAGGDFEIYYNHGYSYNIDDIYGLVASAWDTDVIISQVENPKNESLKEDMEDDEDYENEILALAKFLEIQPSDITPMQDRFTYGILPAYKAKVGNEFHLYNVSSDTYDIKRAVEESMENLFDGLTVQEFIDKIVPYLSGNANDYLEVYGDMDLDELIDSGSLEGVWGDSFHGVVNCSKLADDVISIYGAGHELSSYDSNTYEEELDGITYYIFKQDEQSEDFDESLKRTKKSVKEEYGVYKDDPDFEEIASQLEQGNTYGTCYSGTEWGEVEVDDTRISDLLKTNEVRDWVLNEISYPVRDGFSNYYDLELNFNNYSYYPTIDHTNEDVIADLVTLGFDEDLIRELGVIDDENYSGDITDPRFKEISTWVRYDINYVGPEEEDDEEPEYLEEWQILYKSIDDEDEYFEEDEQGAQDRFEEVKDKVRQFVKKTYKMVDGDWEEDDVEVLYQDLDESLSNKKDIKEAKINEVSKNLIDRVQAKRTQNIADLTKALEYETSKLDKLNLAKDARKQDSYSVVVYSGYDDGQLLTEYSEVFDDKKSALELFNKLKVSAKECFDYVNSQKNDLFSINTPDDIYAVSLEQIFLGKGEMLNIQFFNKDIEKKFSNVNESKINEVSDKVKGHALGKRIAQARNANKKFMNKYPNNQIAIDKNDPKADEWLKDSADAMNKTAKARKMYAKVVESKKSIKEGLKPFRLTRGDIKYLMSLGYEKSDIAQIQRAANSFKTTYEIEGKKVSRDEAIEKLGREKFLNGLSRSAFHYSASQNADGIEVGFDSSKFFETSLSKNLLNAIKLAEEGTDKTVEVTIKDCVADWYEGVQGQYFEDGKKYSFEEFQSKIYEFDWQVWNKGDYIGGYDKLGYTANITVNGEDNTYTGRIDLGDGKDGPDYVNIAEYMKKYIGEDLKANVVITNEIPPYKPEEYAKKYGTFKENAEKYIAENTRKVPQGTDYSKRTAETIAVGDIFYDSDSNSYGQYYYDFYRVTRKTKASIWVEPLKQQTYELPAINSKGNRMDYVKYAFPTDEVADAKYYVDITKPFRLKKSYSGDVMAVQGSGYSQQYIRPWNGKPMKK